MEFKNGEVEKLTLKLIFIDTLQKHWRTSTINSLKT